MSTAETEIVQSKTVTEDETVQSKTVTLELSTLITPPDNTLTRGHEQHSVELDSETVPRELITRITPSDDTLGELGGLGEVDMRNKDDEAMPVDFENVIKDNVLKDEMVSTAEILTSILFYYFN